MASDDLAKQVAREFQEIQDAPTVTPGPPAGRCAWCGQLAQEVEFVDELHGIERYRGVECCGRRTVVQVRARTI